MFVCSMNVWLLVLASCIELYVSVRAQCARHLPVVRRFALMYSDKQLSHTESPPYILYTHTNALTQSHRYEYSSS